jgi:hypothetical protein
LDSGGGGDKMMMMMLLMMMVILITTMKIKIKMMMMMMMMMMMILLMITAHPGGRSGPLSRGRRGDACREATGACGGDDRGRLRWPQRWSIRGRSAWDGAGGLLERGEGAQSGSYKKYIKNAIRERHLGRRGALV